MSLADRRRNQSRGEPDPQPQFSDNPYLRTYQVTARPRRRRRRRQRFNGLVFLVFLIAGAVAYKATHRAPQAPAADVTSQQSAPPVLVNPDLNLGVAKQNGDLLLTWNRTDPKLSSPREGTLLIEDGSQHRSLHLTPEQLSGGTIIYQPQSPAVQFTLQITDRQGVVLSGSSRYSSLGTQK